MSNALTNESVLLEKISAAVQAANTAEQSVAAAQTELVSRSRTLGLLLLEAKKLHPAVKEFEAFLKRVDGLKLSRAYDLLRLAGGRTTDEELRKEARERQAKSREQKKLPKPEPTLPKPEPGFRDTANVTESAEESAANTDLALTPAKRAARQSASALAEFSAACRTYLPKITVAADQQMARLLVSELTTSKRKAA